MDILLRRNKPKTYKLKCSICGEEIERVNRHVKVRCFECKIKARNERSARHRAKSASTGQIEV